MCTKTSLTRPNLSRLEDLELEHDFANGIADYVFYIEDKLEELCRRIVALADGGGVDQAYFINVVVPQCRAELEVTA